MAQNNALLLPCYFVVVLVLVLVLAAVVLPRTACESHAATASQRGWEHR